MKYRQTLAAVGAGLVLATGALLGATPASAQTPDAMVRAAHFSPTTPGVDVYLSPFSGAGKLWLSAVKYGTVSPYFRLTPGLYTVALRLHGHAATEPPALQWTLDAVGGRAYTVAGVGAGTSVKGVVIHDDLSTPSTGTGRVRVIQAASRAPTLTVTATQNDQVVAKDVAFATTSPYSTVKSGDLSLHAAATDSSVSTTSTVDVKSATVTSVLVLDAQGSGITIRAIVDSSGTANMPRGPVSAGGGGTAAGGAPTSADRSTVPVGLLAMIAVLAGVACVATFRLSRTRA
jgi:Domain of unknown function (DUF4397)